MSENDWRCGKCGKKFIPSRYASNYTDLGEGFYECYPSCGGDKVHPVDLAMVRALWRKDPFQGVVDIFCFVLAIFAVWAGIFLHWGWFVVAGFVGMVLASHLIDVVLDYRKYGPHKWPSYGDSVPGPRDGWY